MEAEEPGTLEDACSDLVPEAAIAEAIAPSFFIRGDESSDPATPPYPRGLVLDLALKSAPVADLLDAYDISTEAFREIARNPVFRRDMLEMRDKLKEEGFSFRLKAQAQAEQYLQQAWKLVHDGNTPSNVRADLIKWTTKVAGLEPRPSDPQFSSSGSVTFLPQLAEQLKSMPDGELEMKVMQVVLRNAKKDMQEVHDITSLPA